MKALQTQKMLMDLTEKSWLEMEIEFVLLQTALFNNNKLHGCIRATGAHCL